jgi:hypothetical protein
VLLGAFVLTYQLSAEMLIGALIAFMGVNAAAVKRFYLRGPGLSATFCRRWPDSPSVCISGLASAGRP